MAKGDIVLIRFPFTDLGGSKLRPAVVLIDSPHDITACFITSRLHAQEATDILLRPTPANGLRSDSLLRSSKIATLDRELARGLLGRLSQEDVAALNTRLKELLQLT